MTQHSFKPTATALAATLLLGLHAGSASAQQDESSAVLPPVLVTANKRVEKLERVPSAISVLSEEAIGRNRVTDFQDIVRLIPSLTVSTSTSTSGNNSILMRGIGTSSFSIGVSPDVAVIVDDIPIGLAGMAFKDLADISRIEVLKGPQSTLFGRASIAGVVNIVTKPVTGPLAGQASAEFTSDRERRLKLSYGGSLSDQFGFRIALGDNDFPGLSKNLALDKRTNGNASRTALLKLRWTPTPDIDIDFSPRYNKTTTSCCVVPITSVGTGVNYGGVPSSEFAKYPLSQVYAGINIAPGNLDVRQDRETFQIYESTGASLKASRYLGNGFSLVSITGFEHTKSQDQNDADYTALPLNAIQNAAAGLPPPPAGAMVGQGFFGTFDVKTVTQEFRVVSPEQDKLRYVAGLWYARNFIDRFFQRGVEGVPSSSPRKYVTTVMNRNTAVFGQFDWDFAPDYTLTAGGRINREASAFTFKRWDAQTIPNPLNPSQNVANLGTFKQVLDLSNVDGRFGTPEAVDTVFTSKLALQHQFSKQLMGYVSRSTGYKGYAYDLLSSTDRTRASLQPVDPETATSYEVGAKGNFLNNTVTVAVAAFNTDIKNFQSTSSTPATDPVTNVNLFLPFLNSVGEVRSRGVEIDVTALLTRQLLVNAALAYTDAKITKYPFGDCYEVIGSGNGDRNSNCIIGNPARGGANTSDKAGNPLPQAPKLKLNVGAQYDVALDGAFNAFVTGGVRYQSETVTSLMNPTIKTPAHSISRLGFGVKDKAGKYSLTISIENLFDKRYSLLGDNTVPTTVSSGDLPGIRDAAGKTVMAQGWFPARDSLRYVAARFDVRF